MLLLHVGSVILKVAELEDTDMEIVTKLCRTKIGILSMI